MHFRLQSHQNWYLIMSPSVIICMIKPEGRPCRFEFLISLSGINPCIGRYILQIVVARSVLYAEKEITYNIPVYSFCKPTGVHK